MTPAPPLFSRPSFTVRWLLPILGLLVFALAALAFQLWTTRMPGEGSADVTFARDMSAHHDQAVEMAMIARDRGVDEDLRTIALDIVMTQQAQSGMMHGWLQVWRQPISEGGAPMGGMGEMMGMASFEAGTQRGQAIMVGSREELIEKILDAHAMLGRDRFYGQVDWGALPRTLVEESMTRFATEIAPAVRRATAPGAA